MSSRGPKFNRINVDMSYVAFRKIVTYAIKCSIIFCDIFYCQPVHVGDGYIEYNYMELKEHIDMGNMFFFIFLEFHSKGRIELYVTFG